MKELLLYMAKNLVDDPDSVTVTEIDDEDGKILELRVAPGDMGKVIGRQGRIAKEIRTIDSDGSGLGQRIVGTNLLDAATVTGAAGISNDNTVVRSLLSTHSSQSDLNHGISPP